MHLAEYFQKNIFDETFLMECFWRKLFSLECLQWDVSGENCFCWNIFNGVFLEKTVFAGIYSIGYFRRNVPVRCKGKRDVYGKNNNRGKNGRI
jgi:hypothetical protein